MKSFKHLGVALGFLAGTTFGSGIAFLFRFSPVQLMLSVALFGIAGILSGLLTSKIWYNQIQEH
ncbi:hypothetical protein SAMN05720606_108222 [Paenibacillus polysaccharolyticus]|uniref:Uncharacterized protein n=1 Tax=Paenibacillus polysaccharolyticus TaxID=582692 RepID=A0A1G5IDK9_9BACL|nr:hypothetical protein [Paenibacillus polysaccharolyticus]SCY74245.1 hypothetical protein SAMN05720606_108222 [Paenibacillus polysaccharolyticus]